MQSPPARDYNLLTGTKRNGGDGGAGGQQPQNQQQSPTQVPKLDPEDEMKILEKEIKTLVAKFNHPLLEYEAIEVVRKRISILYNEKGAINKSQGEKLDAVYDHTRSLEYFYNDTAFLCRAFLFMEFGLPRQAYDDAVKAYALNQKSSAAFNLIKSLEQKVAELD